MFPDADPSESLKGCVILADPSLREPTFRHSVLLLTEHSADQGALGYILNRPLGKTVGDLLFDPQFEELTDIPVFIGGPVSTEHLTFSSLGWSESEDRLQFSTHLSAPQALRNLREGFSVRAFVGYSGWAEGQLESEMERNTWITRDPEKRLLDTESLDTLWNRLLRELSPWHALIADEPDDLSLN
ncbi:MAG: YqgE/AlgH family protein [Verrucomicrobiae bacterium]|nr:YqgE/AlgH family protein [Verrucomicrobiae bacterium]MCB1088142.1 YqgE/AlgH family protein [Verrucomicrobiae bacterium]